MGCLWDRVGAPQVWPPLLSMKAKPSTQDLIVIPSFIILFGDHSQQGSGLSLNSVFCNHFWWGFEELCCARD